MAWGGVALLGLLLAGCATSTPYDRLTHWPATTKSSLSGAGGEGFPAYELGRNGDLAVGRRRNGDAVVLSSHYYHGCAMDGAAYRLPNNERLVSGAAVRFKADLVEAVPQGYSVAKLRARLAKAVAADSVAVAFRLVGRFEQVRLSRRVTLPRTSGMIIGFVTPDEAGGGEGSLRLHFLSNDWLTGGRVEDFQLIDGSLALDICPQYLRIWPAERAAAARLRH